MNNPNPQGRGGEAVRDRRTLSERLRDIARTLERHGWLREEGERPVYWIEKAATALESQAAEIERLKAAQAEGYPGLAHDYELCLFERDKARVAELEAKARAARVLITEKPHG